MAELSPVFGIGWMYGARRVMPKKHAGKEPPQEFFYFQVSSDDNEISGYVTRDQFNWLAEKLGLPLVQEISGRNRTLAQESGS